MSERCDVVSRKFGKCKNLAYKEGYFKKGENSWWSYVCRKHFYEMKEKDKRLEGWCSI